MNHQPFRDWLLSDDRPTTDQLQALQEHLRDCPTCRQLETSWGDVLALMKKAPDAEPQAGFTARWHDRLAAHRLRQQRRQAWVMVGITCGVVLFLGVLFGAQVLDILRSPAQLLLVWISRLTTAMSVFYTLRGYFSTLVGSLPAFSYLGLFFSFGILCFMSVAWLAAYRRLTMARELA